MSKKRRKPRAKTEEAAPGRAAFFSLPAAFAAWYVFIGVKLAFVTDPSLWRGLVMPFQGGAPRVVPLLPLAGGYLLDLVYLAAFALAALGYGMPAVRWIFRAPLSGLERALIAQALGLGTLSLLTLLIGTAVGVTPGLAFALIGAGLGLTAMELIHWLRHRSADSPEYPGFFASLSRLEGFLLAFIAVSVLYHLIGALAPETFYDSLVYHLGAPNLYRLRGRIGPIDGILHANFPQNMEMLYLLGLLLRGETLAKLMHLWMMLLTLLGMYGLGRTACSRATALTACALFTAVPVAAFAVWHTSVEAGLAFWALMGLWALIRGIYAHTSPDRTAVVRWFLVSGIFHGLALGVKYTAGWNAAAATAILVIWSFREASLARGERFALFAVWSLGVCAVFAPWLLKNAFLMGNPVYPFLNGIFGTGAAYPDVEGLKASARGHYWYGGLLSWKTWLLMPWKLFIEGRSHYSFIGPLLVAFFPLMFRFRKVIFPFGWILLAFLVQYVAWSASTSMIRFLIPALPLFCLYMAHQLTLLGRQRHAWAPWLAAPVLLWNLAWNGAMLIQKEVPGVVFGRETADQYLGRPHIGYPHQQYEMSLFIRRELPEDARLLLVGEVRTAFLARDSAAHSLFDESLLLEFLVRSRTAGELYAVLRATGFTHVLADYPEAKRNIQKRLQSLTPDQLRVMSRFWRGYLREMRRSDHDVVLYALQEPAGPVPAARGPAGLPEIVRIALDASPTFRKMSPDDRARLLMSLAN